MSWHHYYDHDFITHLHQVNPVLAAQLSQKRIDVKRERDRLKHEYQDALDLALRDNIAEIAPLLRPCHRKDVEQGVDLKVTTRMW